MTLSNDETLARLRSGGEAALAEFLVDNWARLRDNISKRLPQQVAARIDGSDVLQEAYLRASAQLDTYLAAPKIPPLQWLRRICVQTLLQNHERHFDTEKRSVNRESISYEMLELEKDDSAVYHPRIHSSTPSSIVRRKEVREKLVELIATMSELDQSIIREIHVAGRSVREASVELEISYEAAKKRYRRAVSRLADVAWPLK